MHPILLKLGSFTIYSYGFMMALAFLAGIALAAWLAKKENIGPDKIFDLALYVILVSIIGARIFYIFEFWADFYANPISMFYIWEGGLVFFGGVFFAIIAVYVFSKLSKLSAFKLLDVLAPATALGYAIGRVGCFLRGCCYGCETAVPWALNFPDVPGLRHPTQIYASLAGLLMMGILIFILYRKKFDGQVFSIGLILYSIYRFLIEFIRVNPRYLFNLTEAQWGSALIFVIAAVLYFYLSKQKKITN